MLTLRDLLYSIALVAAAMLVSLATGCVPTPAHAQVPQAAQAWRADLARAARAVWGIDAPVATFAAQVHQESAWRPGAMSRVGAAGLAQFMPATASWISPLYPELSGAEPLNPGWALRALVRYDAWLYERVRAASPCERFGFVLSAYNGGLGWVQRDKALARRESLDAAVWFGQVDQVNAGRSAVNWRENRDYPRRILLRHEPLYVAAGWGPGVCS
jgi:soluble lytic murein transglycosylase-like protein